MRKSAVVPHAVVIVVLLAVLAALLWTAPTSRPLGCFGGCGSDGCGECTTVEDAPSGS